MLFQGKGTKIICVFTNILIVFLIILFQILIRNALFRQNQYKKQLVLLLWKIIIYSLTFVFNFSFFGAYTKLYKQTGS